MPSETLVDSYFRILHRMTPVDLRYQGGYRISFLYSPLQNKISQYLGSTVRKYTSNERLLMKHNNFVYHLDDEGSLSSELIDIMRVMAFVSPLFLWFRTPNDLLVYVSWNEVEGYLLVDNLEFRHQFTDENGLFSYVKRLVKYLVSA